MYEMSMQIIVGPFPVPVYSSSIKCALKQTVVKCFTELCCLKDDKSLITVGDSRRETRIWQLPINMMYLMYYISVLVRLWKWKWYMVSLNCYFMLSQQEICFITYQVGMMFYMFLRSHEFLTERELPVCIVFPRNSLSRCISSKVWSW